VIAFTTRIGGVSRAPFDTLNVGRSTADEAEAVAENRRRILGELGLDENALATAGQVHGIDVTAVKDAGLTPDCDALVTRVPGLAIAVTGADCVPIVFDAGTAVAVAHSGWRGTAAGMPRTALKAVCGTAEVSPSAVTAFIGPSIRSCCYEVGPEVAGQFHEASVVHDGPRLRLDLVDAVRRQLLEAGMAEAAIHTIPDCTVCLPQRYFSHRRDGVRTGRQWAIAALRR
jgi:YfiH family protein